LASGEVLLFPEYGDTFSQETLIGIIGRGLLLKRSGDHVSKLNNLSTALGIWTGFPFCATATLFMS
jgi:hypothetical protein